MAGATAVSATVNGALLVPSAVTTICADDWPLSAGGICRLICCAPVYSSSAGISLNVTVTFCPARLLPQTVASEPGATGPGWKSAASVTLPITTAGVGAVTVGAVTVRVSGKLWLPAMPASISTVAW